MSTFLSGLLTSTLFLVIGGGIVFLLLRFFGCRSSLTHRTAWAVVLLLGVLWFRIPLEIPVWTPPQPIRLETVETPLFDSVPKFFDVASAQEPGVVQEKAPGWVKSEPSVTHPGTTASTPIQETPPALEKSWTLEHGLYALFGIWTAGIAWFAGRGFIAWLRMLRQLRKTTVPEGIFATEWESLLAERGMSPQRVRLAMSDRIGPGLVRSLRNYIVVVPRTLWEEADATVRRGILKHELSHYVHGDLATSFVLRLISLIHWFNPMAAYAVRRFEDATEWRCDAEAFGRYENGVSDFARALLAFRDTVPVTAMYRRDFCGNNIVERARRLVDVHQNLGDSTMKKTAIFCCVLLLLCGSLFRVQLVAQSTAQEPGGIQEKAPELVKQEKKSTQGQPIRGLTPPALEKSTALTPVTDVKWVEIRGKVVAPNGEPADGIKLTAIGLSDRGQCSENVDCDKNGEFKMNVFPNNYYFIGVFDEKGRYTAPDYEIPIATESPKEAITIAIRKGTPFELKFVDETTGKPIPGLRINLLRTLREKTRPNYSGTMIYGKNTDDEGRFTANLMPGEYTFGVDFRCIDPESVAEGVYAREVVVGKDKPFSMEVRIPTPFTGKVIRADGSPAEECYVYSPGKRLLAMSTDKNGIFRTARPIEDTSITISALDKTEQYFGWVGKELQPLKEFTFQLAKPFMVKGRLLDAATKEPLVERMICYWKKHPTDPHLAEYLPSTTKTDKEGRFTLKTIPSLKYDVFVVHGRDAIYNGGPYYPRIDLATLEPKNDMDLGDLFVDVTKAVDDSGTTPKAIEEKKTDSKENDGDFKFVLAKGRAVFPDGKPIGGLQIMAGASQRNGKGHSGTNSATTKEDGSFTIQLWPDSNFIVSIFDPQGRWCAPYQTLEVGHEKEYAGEIVFPLEKGVAVRGKIVDENSKEPIPDMDVSVSFYVDEQTDDVDKRKYAFSFFKIQADKEGVFRFLAAPQNELYVNVGSLPKSYLLQLKEKISTETDPAKKATLEKVAQMQGVPGIEKTTKQVVFDGTKPVELDFAIPTPFVGKVLKSNGSPAVDAMVQFMPFRPFEFSKGMEPGKFTKTDEKGIFRLENRPKRAFCLIWSADTREVLVQWFDDDLPKEGEKVFQLQRGCFISGRLIDSETKKPLANQLVLFERSSVEKPERLDYIPTSMKTDKGGRFTTLFGIAPGVRYTFFAVPGLREYYGGTTDKRVDLKTVVPEKPGEKIDLGDLEVDLSKQEPEEGIQEKAPGLVKQEKQVEHPGATASTPIQEKPPAPAPQTLKPNVVKEAKFEPVRPVQDRKKVKVKFRVLTPSGEVADGINFQLSGYRSENWTIIGGGGEERFGEFEIEVPADESFVAAVFDKRNRYAAPMQTLTVGNEPPEGEIVFRFEEGVPFTAEFVDEKTGEPIPGLRIHLMQRADVPDGFAQIRFEKMSDEKGLFQAHLLPGEYVVSVDSLYNSPEAVAKGIYARKIVAELGKIVTEKFAIPAPFVGKILSVDGLPARNRSVAILPIERGGDERPVTTITTTDEDGFFRRIGSVVDVMVRVRDDYRNTDQYLAWFADELKDANEHTFRLVRGTEVTGRLLDAKTKEPLGNRLFFRQCKNPSNAAQQDYLPDPKPTDKNGRFTIRLNPTVLNELFVVYGRNSRHGGGPYFPRIDLATLGPEQLKDKDGVDLGDILVDPDKAVADPKPRSEGTDKSIEFQRTKRALYDQVKWGEKKAVVWIVARTKSKDFVRNIVKQTEGLLKDYAVIDDVPDDISEYLLDGWKTRWDDYQETPLYVFWEGWGNIGPHATLEQLRGETESPWNVPKDDPSCSGDWKKSPGAVNPKIFENFLREKISDNKTENTFPR